MGDFQVRFRENAGVKFEKMNDNENGAKIFYRYPPQDSEQPQLVCFVYDRNEPYYKNGYDTPVMFATVKKGPYY